MNVLEIHRLEIRRSVAVWLFPLMVAALALLARESLSPVAVWIYPNTVSAIQPNLAWLSPLAGGLAAWAATRERRKGTEDLLSTTPCPAFVRDLASWASIAVWCCFAYAFASAVFLLLTYSNATWGSPVLEPTLIGLAEIAAYSALGYAAGTRLPSRFTAPLVAIALFLLQVSLGAVRQFGINSLSPAAGLELSVWHEEIPDLYAPQVLVFFGLLGIGLAATGLRRGRTPYFWGVLLVAAFVAVVGSVALLRASPPTAAQERAAAIPYSPVCRKDGEQRIRVCVHPAY